MANRLIYLPVALKEFDESFEFYEERKEGLGINFRDEIMEKLDSISNHPERYRNKKSNFRETIVDNFPFLIIYKYYKTKNIILITSIFHTSRNPKYKYRK